MNWTEAEVFVENGNRVGIVGDPMYVEKMNPTYESITTGETIKPHVNRWDFCKYNPSNNDFEQNYTPDEVALAAEWELR
jgi:hypothetical protein